MYISPFLITGIGEFSNLNNLYIQDLFPTLYRSIIFGIFFSVFVSILSLLFNYNFVDVKRDYLFGFLLIPFLLGNVNTTFVFKVIFLNSSFFDSILKGEVYQKFILLTIMLLWQLGTLFLYLQLLNNQFIPKNKFFFSRVIKLNRVELLQDIYLPSSKNLTIIVLLISFIFTLYERSFSENIFHFSQGTDTQLISSWISNKYLLFQQFDLASSTNNLYTITFFLTITFIICFLLFAFVSRYIYDYCITSKYFKYFPIVTSKSHRLMRNILFFILVLFVVAPILILFIKVNSFGDIEVKSLVKPFCLTLFAAALCTGVAISFAIILRLKFEDALNDFNLKSLLIISTLFTINLIPSMTIKLCAHKWLSIFSLSNSMQVYLGWVLSHCIILFPLICSFTLLIHFKIKNYELRFLRCYDVPLNNVIKFNFFKRFYFEYLFVFILTFAMIWNDDNINNVYSDLIPSYSVIMYNLVSGRGANYSTASIFLIISIIMTISIIIFWLFISSNLKNLNENHRIEQR